MSIGQNEGTVRIYESLSTRLTVRAELRHWPLTVLGLTQRTANALREAGIAVLGDLDGLNGEELLMVNGVGVEGVQEMHDRLKRLSSVPNIEQLVALDAAGQALPPQLPVAMLLAVSNAKTINDEMEALLVGLSERNAAIVRDRWCIIGSASNLEAIGARFGITRERVRQIVEKPSITIRCSNLRLPICGQIVSLVRDAGGALSSERLVRSLRSLAYDASARELRFVQSVGALGITGGRIFFSPRHRLWIYESQHTDPGEALRKAEELLAPIRSQVAKRFQRTGAITLKELRRLSPFGAAHAVSVALRRRSRFRRVGSYLVPTPSGDTPVTRAIQKALVVTNPLSVSDIYAGLRQSVRALEMPPMDVLLEALRNHPEFRVEKEMVYTAIPLLRENILSPSELVLVNALEKAGGILLWTEIAEAISDANFSHATFGFSLRAPFVARRASAVYALRGRHIESAVLQRKVKQRSAARRSQVNRVRQLGIDAIEVQFTLTSVSIQGVLTLPAKIRRLHIPRWRGVFPDGREEVLVARNAFLWNIGRWLRDTGARAGDIIVATFYVAEARLEFNEPLRGSENG